MSRSTRSATVSNVPHIDSTAVCEKTDSSTISKKKCNPSLKLDKSTVATPRKFVSSKRTDLKEVPSKISTRDIRTHVTSTRDTRQKLGATKHSGDATSNRATPSRKIKLSRVIRSVGDKSMRNTIKVEPSCNETVTRTVRKINKMTDKSSSTVAENTSSDLDVTNLHSFRPYTTADDANRLGLFNPLNFTTMCAIDSITFEFSCQSCRIVRFKTFAELRLHEDWCGRTVRDDKFYKCRTCDYKYHSLPVLNRHESECKQDKSQIEKRESANPFNFSTIFAPDFRDFPFFCTSCHIVSFRTLDEMRVHENWCGMVLIGLRDSVICKDCGVAFRHTTVLNGHREGPPGCTRNGGVSQKRSASPLKGNGMSGSMDSKRRKLNRNATTSKVAATASKVKRKFAVVLSSKRKRIPQKSAAMFAKMKTKLSAMKVETPSLDSSIECSPTRKNRIIQVTKKQLPSVTTQKDDSKSYSSKSKSASQSKNNEFDSAEEMILESAISAADQASSVPGYQAAEKNTCPVCDVVIVGSVDDMCLHFQHCHNLALSSHSPYSGRARFGRIGPTNCLDCDTLFDSRLEMTRHKQVCPKKSVPKSVPKDSIPRFMCAICSTVAQNLEEFDTHVETFHGGVDEYQQILLNKLKLNRLPPNDSNAFLRVIVPLRPPHRVMCAICPAVVESRDEFNTHIQTFHGGVDKYQETMFGNNIKPCRAIPVESSGSSECFSENTNEQALAIEIKPEIVDEINVSPVVNSAVLGVVIPVKMTTTSRRTVDISRNVEVSQRSRSPVSNEKNRRTVDISPNVEVSQKSLNHVSNEKTNIDLVTNKNSRGVKNNLVVDMRDIQSPGGSLSKSVLGQPSTAASGPGSSQVTVISDELRAVKNPLRVEDMVASITVNRSLNTKGAEGCVGKIKLENNTANIQSNTPLEVAKKPSNPQLPVVFNTSALQSMFLKNGRRRLRLQTSLIPGSDIVVVGTETTNAATKYPTDNNSQTNDNKLSTNVVERNKIANSSELGENIEENKLASTEAKPTSGVDAVPSPRVGEDEEQKKLLLALQLVPSSSVQSPEHKDGTTIVRKSKRQIAKQVDSVEKTTVEKRAMKMIAAKRDIRLTAGTGVSKLNKDKRPKISTESVNTSRGSGSTCKAVEVPTRLSTCSVVIRKLREQRKSIVETANTEQYNRHVRESCSLEDLPERKQSSSRDTTSVTKQSSSGETATPTLLSEKDIESQSEPVMSTSLTHPVECPTVQSLSLSHTLVQSGETGIKPVKKPSSDALVRPSESVSNISEAKSSGSSGLLIPAKKNTRRNLRILEPIDDELLKCLECGSILRTAIEIVSHACPD